MTEGQRSNAEIKIGTSGHLLLGVVRIYDRKAKYLLADCSEAFVKIKWEFRSGQTDLQDRSLEAKYGSITLMENFTDLDLQPLGLSSHADEPTTLHQCRPEEITLQEDLGSSFLNPSQLAGTSTDLSRNPGLCFQSMSRNEDSFGDENGTLSMLDLLTSPDDQDQSADFLPLEQHMESWDTPRLVFHPDAGEGEAMEMEAEASAPSESTPIANTDHAFALEPVATTSCSVRSREHRRRRLIVDQTKELTGKAIRAQLEDFSDLLVPLDVAPPTRKLMEWKEMGGAATLLGQPCCSIVAPQIREMFDRNIVSARRGGDGGDVDRLRCCRDNTEDVWSSFSTDSLREAGSPASSQNLWSEPDRSTLSLGDASTGPTEDGSWQEDSHPELPPEDPMQAETRAASVSPKAMLDSQDTETKRIVSQTQRLHQTLKRVSHTTAVFSLQALCRGCTRQQAAVTFICLLLLKMRQVLQLQQSAPYQDILASPGPRFYTT